MSTKSEPIEPWIPSVQPVWQFIVLCVFSGGMYPFYWSWRFWKYIKLEYGLPVKPELRSAFHFLTAGHLFSKVAQLAEARGYQRDFSPVLFGLAYYLLFISRFFGFPLAWASFLSFVAFLPAFRCFQYYLVVNYGAKARYQKGFTRSEMRFIIVLWMVQLVVLFAISGSLLSFMD
jgi:hypothetical protein